MVWTAGIIVSITIIALLAWIVWIHSMPLSGESEALIVLGYRCSEEEPMPELLRERLEAALELLARHTFRFVLLTGGAVGSGRSEASIMHEYLTAHGVSPAVLVQEDASRDTIENLRNCRVYLEREGIRSVVLVSNSFHLRRLSIVARRLGLPNAGCYARRTRLSPWRQIGSTLHEAKALASNLRRLVRGEGV